MPSSPHANKPFVVSTKPCSVVLDDARPAFNIEPEIAGKFVASMMVGLTKLPIPLLATPAPQTLYSPFAVLTTEE